ncbi:MAG: molybdate ABC transporter permease subunit [Phenylobacterium sp.]|uniref:molybdate ABC transporter permease subunit n=1 Tax=Phenylobacterium sp. TaxID=1871053 RepID=UPI001A3DFD58|nr:molybdate ABC transporter permease subunit [Phenylobacterium sp.]MBL8553938.1 molybdate ABC transporter permease subunit [Phenylobacterium sp.]
MSELLPVVWLTLKLAGVTTAILLVIATPLAWWLARTRGAAGQIVGAVVALPIVLPPTVLGFYLLIALGPNSPLMAPLQALGVRTLAFTFTGLVIGSLVYSLPFAVQPLRNAFAAVGDDNIDAAATLGASGLQTFFRVVLPLSAPGYAVGAILTFAHTIGEFGVVLMIGGAIPGVTNVLSIEIFKSVEALEWGRAHVLAALLTAFGFAVVLGLLRLEHRFSVAPLNER